MTPARHFCSLLHPFRLHRVWARAFESIQVWNLRQMTSLSSVTSSRPSSAASHLLWTIIATASQNARVGPLTTHHAGAPLLVVCSSSTSSTILSPVAVKTMSCLLAGSRLNPALSSLSMYVLWSCLSIPANSFSTSTGTGGCSWIASFAKVLSSTLFLNVGSQPKTVER